MALQEYYNTNDDGGSTLYGVFLRGQSWTAASGYTLEKVALLLYRVGSPGTITLELYAADGAQKPTGSALATGTLDGDTLTTNTAGEWVDISYSVGYAVTNAVQYVHVVTASSGDASNKLGWRLDSSSPTYAGGLYLSSSNNGSTWGTVATIDFMFENYSSDATSDYDEGTLSVSGDGSVAIVGEGWLYEEGALAVSGSGSVTLSTEHPGYTEGILSVAGDGSVLLASETVSLTEMIAVAGTGAFDIVVEAIGRSELLQVLASGSVLFSTENIAVTELLAIAAAAVADLNRQAYQDMSGWPLSRASDYDPDLYWDEETATWSSTRVESAGGTSDYAIFIGEQGEIYYYEAV